MYTKKNLTRIKGLSEAKVDKICEAAEKIVNIGYMTGSDLILRVSEDKISFLTGGEDPYSDEVVYNRLFHPNLKLLVVTEGENGCRYYTKNFHGRVAGFSVRAVDTTGAGDSFVSGLLTHLDSNLDLYKYLVGPERVSRPGVLLVAVAASIESLQPVIRRCFSHENSMGSLNEV